MEELEEKLWSCLRAISALDSPYLMLFCTTPKYLLLISFSGMEPTFLAQMLSAVISGW